MPPNAIALLRRPLTFKRNPMLERLDDLHIRPARPDDRQRIVNAFRALDPQSVYQRFFFPKAELSEAELRWVSEPDADRNVVLLATQGKGEREQVIAVGQYTRSGGRAEVAFTVAEDYRGRGIARRLLRELADIARKRDVSCFEADVLADNRAMLEVFRRGGFPVHESEAHGVVHVTISLGPQNRKACAAS